MSPPDHREFTDEEQTLTIAIVMYVRRLLTYVSHMLIGIQMLVCVDDVGGGH